VSNILAERGLDMNSKLEFNLKEYNGVLEVFLAGDLDSSSSPKLLKELDYNVKESINRVIFLMDKLEYISIKGIRTIFFVKERVADSSDVVLVGAQNNILDILKLSELDDFFVIKESEEQYN